uniref:Rhodanese domain-containing protein n=1 Tax=Fibrocapsa japonica TaxID=94617 RepID=A0A7S2V3B9_9STRA|mmetsp:Transcript_5168/g.7865  ORF Transcript_5168/g.7865 Transcript_5168/m.7865 type:complete len:331 (+) Transcript_5168:2-994(+)
MAEFTTLLFYFYVDIDQNDLPSIIEEQIQLCQRLGMRGRFRVSPEGMNGTADGEDDSIKEYMRCMDEDERWPQIHWKLGKCSEITRNPFLSVKKAKEVVSLDLHPKVNEKLKSIETGEHLSPEEFHSGLLEATKNGPNSNTILLDVRNLYESRIGRFEADGISTVDPMTRKFSDFRSFVDENADDLRNKTIFAYCTGGVRCEKATQYLKYAAGVSNVKQCHGGIHAYLEQFPDGGFFRGKNFVYDPRIAVAPRDSSLVVGQCALCSAKYDNYEADIRCSLCRMLVLACDECQNDRKEELESIVCEHCHLSGRQTLKAQNLAQSEASAITA